MSDKAQSINIRIAPVTRAELGAINILTPEERRVVLLAAARTKAVGILDDTAVPAKERPDADR